MKATKKILSLILAAALVFGSIAVVANAAGLTDYAGSVQTFVVSSDRTSDGKTQVKIGETIKITVSMSTNYYTGSGGGEFFAWTKGVFEDLGDNYAAKNFTTTFTNNFYSPAASGAHPTTHPIASWEGFQVIRANNSGVTKPTVVDMQEVYEFNFTVKNDESLIGTTAVFEIPAAALKTPTNPNRKGLTYQGISSTIDKITDLSTGKYAETVNLDAAKLEIEIISAEEPAVPCNYDALNAAIAKYDGLTESEYTPNSWSASGVVAAAAAANGVDKNLTVDEAGANQKTIDDAAAALKAAIAELVEKANKDALVAAINTAVDKTNCTSASIADYDAALETANSVNADENVDQTTVDNATTALNNAIAGLTKLGKCDYTALDAAIALAPEKDKEYYNADDYAAWEAAKAEAQAVTRDMYADEAGVNQAAIKAATDKLTAAYAKLVPSTLDIAVLTDAIAASTTPEYAEEYYDAAAYEAWEAALAAAQAGVTTYTGAADTAANRAAVKDLADDLTAKFEALEPAMVDLSPLYQATYNYASPTYFEEYYDAADYAAWEAALDAANAAIGTYANKADTAENRAAVKALADDLIAKYNALEPKFVDLAELNEAIADFSTTQLTEEYYIAADYAAWKTALDAAKNGAIEYDGAADTAENRAAVKALADDLVAKGLALEPQYVDLAEVYNANYNCATPAFAEEYYDADAYAAWQAAYQLSYNAPEVYGSAADTEENRAAVAKIAEDLRTAYAALEPKFLDVAPLEKVLADCKPEYPEIYYTEDSWGKYSETYALTEEALASLKSNPQPDTASLRATRDEYVKYLTKAYNDLEAKESMIIRVTPLRTDYAKNDVVNFEVEVEGVKASKLQFLTSAGKTITIDKKSPDFVGITTNEAGNEVWTVAIRIYTDEDVVMYARAKVGSVWDNGYFAFDIKPTGKPDYSAKSAVVTLNDSEVDTFTVKDTVSLVITTGADVTKIRLVNQATGSTATYSTPASVNVDGTKVWVVTKKYGTAKEYAFDVYTRGQTKAWADSNVDLAFTVTATPVPQVPSTGVVEDAIFSASAAAGRIFRGDTQVFTVVTDKDAKEIRILNSKGEVVVKSTTGVVEGSEKTWTISRVYNVDGAYNYTVEAKYGSTWHKDADGAISFTVAY